MILAAIFLSTTVKVIVDAFARPYKQKHPLADLWWLFYPAAVLGMAVGWFSQINLFAEFMPDLIVGRVLTSILIGGGSTLIHDLFSVGIAAGRSLTVKNWSEADKAMTEADAKN